MTKAQEKIIETQEKLIVELTNDRDAYRNIVLESDWLIRLGREAEAFKAAHYQRISEDARIIRALQFEAERLKKLKKPKPRRTKLTKAA